jgi:hypothetical protein
VCPRSSGKRQRHGFWKGREVWLHLNLHTLIPYQLDTRPLVLSAAPIPRSRSGAGPTASGCRRMLTWRGFLVASPFHWHCSRNSQGRQLRILAAYTSRRLPSASCRRAFRVSVRPAGQRKVPSGWSGKSCPVKRPVFQDVAVVGGPYPEAEAVAVGRVAACAFCSGMAGANSVMRMGVGSN